MVAEFIHRCCFECGHLYFGPLTCPDCLGPGEPLLAPDDVKESANDDD